MRITGAGCGLSWSDSYGYRSVPQDRCGLGPFADYRVADYRGTTVALLTARRRRRLAASDPPQLPAASQSGKQSTGASLPYTSTGAAFDVAWKGSESGREKGAVLDDSEVPRLTGSGRRPWQPTRGGRAAFRIGCEMVEASGGWPATRARDPYFAERCHLFFSRVLPRVVQIKKSARWGNNLAAKHLAVVPCARKAGGQDLGFRCSRRQRAGEPWGEALPSARC